LHQPDSPDNHVIVHVSFEDFFMSMGCLIQYQTILPSLCQGVIEFLLTELKHHIALSLGKSRGHRQPIVHSTSL
jgi:hypothetical protein